MLIERFHKLYVASDFSEKYRIVNTGKFSVDLKEMKLFANSDKFNASHYRNVKRGHSRIRSRPDVYSRYGAPLPTELDGA